MINRMSSFHDSVNRFQDKDEFPFLGRKQVLLERPGHPGIDAAHAHLGKVDVDIGLSTGTIVLKISTLFWHYWMSAQKKDCQKMMKI